MFTWGKHLIRVVHNFATPDELSILDDYLKSLPDFHTKSVSWLDFIEAEHLPEYKIDDPNVEKVMRELNTRTNKYITDNSDIARRNDAQARFDYVDQAFVSKRYGKERYLDTLNKALADQEMAFEPLVQGMKYVSDKVGINTVVRYNRDIISYAEIFTGEYSVTYDQEIAWK